MRNWVLTRDWKPTYLATTLATDARERTTLVGPMGPAIPFSHPQPCVLLASR